MAALPKPEVAPSSPGRAKPLRPASPQPGSLRLETRVALLAYYRAATRKDARRLAYVLGKALLREVEAGTGALPDDLAELVVKWEDDQFAGTEIDLEVAEFAVA